MNKQIFVNLAVENLQRSLDFYKAIGFTNNQTFTDDSAASMSWSEEIHVMLLTHQKFYELTGRTVADNKMSASVFHSLSVESKDAVNNFITKALRAGATEPTEPSDYGFMQQRSMADPDGHLWLVLYMNLSNLSNQ